MRTTRVLIGLAAMAALSVSAQGALETFNSATVGNNIGQIPGWYGTAGGGWATVNTSGVAGSNGLGAGDQAFNWTANTFDWTAMAVGDHVVIGGDWQADSGGRFNDDRMGWTTTGASSTSSSNHFGTQLDNEAQSGFVCYWKVGSSTNYTEIMDFPTITASGWYRASTKFTKLGAAAARLDVSFQELDAAGNPTGLLYTGTLADTSALATNPAPASYFTATVTPMFKSFNSATGNANFDNAYFSGVVAVPEPATLSVLLLGGLLLGRRRHD